VETFFWQTLVCLSAHIVSCRTIRMTITLGGMSPRDRTPLSAACQKLIVPRKTYCSGDCD